MAEIARRDSRAHLPIHVVAFGRSRLVVMRRVEEIVEAVRGLSAAELSEFREWFAEFDGELWDRQIEADVAAGRLDALADEAMADLRAGRCTGR